MRVLVAFAFCVSVALSQVAAQETSSTGDEFYITRPGTVVITRTTYVDGSDPEMAVTTIVADKIVNQRRKWKTRTVFGPASSNPLAALAGQFLPDDDKHEVVTAWEYYDVGLEAYVSRNADEPREQPFPLMWFPAQKGDVFRTPDGTPVTVLTTSKKVTVPAGTYDCIAYEWDYGRQFPEEDSDDDLSDTVVTPSNDSAGTSSPVTVEYWARGAGMVLVEEYLVKDGKRRLISKNELIAIRVPKEKTEN